MIDDAEIVAEFLVESHENLDQLDRDLVELEQDPHSRDLLSSIFRTIHTIKGTSGFLALHRLEALTHVGENVLARLRDERLTMTPQTAEVLLSMADAVRSLLHLVETTGSDVGEEVPVEAVAAALTAVLEAGTSPARTSLVVVPETSSARAAREEQPVSAPAAAMNEAVAADPVTDEAEPPPLSKLGELLLQAGAATREGIQRAVEEQRRGDTRKLGELLVDLGEADPIDIENALAQQGRRSVVDGSVRVDVALLDGLVRLVGELVLVRNQVLQRTEVAALADSDLGRVVQRLDVVASELQAGVLRTRMQPINQVWSKMPRVVRDLAQQLGRSVRLELEGHDTELDRSLLEALRGSLTHLVRNALDHGIESPAERVAAGKPAEGLLTLRAFHESGQVVVEIADDGRGIDVARVGAVAVERGVVTAEALRRMDARDVQQLVFRPGFSTASEVTHVSGRGVGMDVVRTNIERIGGSVDLSSCPGQGTTCRVRIPLTLAIIPALVVEEGESRYAVPQANLVELLHLEGEELTSQLQVLAGAPVLRLRGGLLPLVSLAGAVEARDNALETRSALTVLVVQGEGIRYGLAVSDVHDTQEIVVKPIGRQLKGLGMYSGATIMGDGRLSLILDVAGLARIHGVEATYDVGRTLRDESADAESDALDRSALLVLEVSPGHRAALPLREVARLEEFAPDAVERCGPNDVVRYHDGLLPLIRLDEALGLARPDARVGPHRMSVVVHERGDQRVGIVVERVLDVVETNLVRSAAGRRAGVLGSALVQERPTELLDLDAVAALAGAGAR